MNNLEKYMNDPDIANEPMPLREIHAIRLKIHDETKGMTPQERTTHTHKKTAALLERYGIKVVTVESPSVSNPV